VTVLDELGNTLLSQIESLPLGREEEREVILRPDDAGRALPRTVPRRRKDAPVLRRRSPFSSTNDAPNSAGRTTDAAGSFRFEAIAEREVSR
jgi:hypothetical protein